MSINFADIKVGDKVKIRVSGLVSEDWMEVRSKSPDGVRVGIWLVTNMDSQREIIAHQPAPRKVEVTLGTPLTEKWRAYIGQETENLISAQARGARWVNFQGLDGYRTMMPSEVRRFALDLLATVGIDDE